MALKRAGASVRPASKTNVKKNKSHDVPEIYQEMLAQELHTRPLKKRKVAGSVTQSGGELNHETPVESEDGDDDNVEFEDVVDVFEDMGSSKILQTAYRDSENDESSESEPDWDMTKSFTEGEAGGNLELTLTEKHSHSKPAFVQRRKAVTNEERRRRLQIHQMHVLCLLAHVERRNQWCNSAEVHEVLNHLLDKKTRNLLLPRSSLSQFARTESLKRGLSEVIKLWMIRYKVRARGMQRALWADNEEDIERVGQVFLS